MSGSKLCYFLQYRNPLVVRSLPSGPSLSRLKVRIFSIVREVGTYTYCNRLILDSTVVNVPAAGWLQWIILFVRQWIILFKKMDHGCSSSLKFTAAKTFSINGKIFLIQYHVIEFIKLLFRRGLVVQTTYQI